MSPSLNLVSLPDEILLAIATAGLTLPIGRHNRGEPPFPVLLSHVSTRLRTLLLRAPLLWTSPRLRAGEKWHAPAQMNAFLARSAPCTLDLALDFCGLPLGTHDALVYTACASAAAHSARWDRLVLADEWGGCLPVALAALRDVRAPRLRGLELKLAHFPWRLNVPFSACLHGGAPNLRALTLHDAPLPWSSLATFPRLTILTIFFSFGGFEPTLNELRALFAALPELSELSLRGNAAPTFDDAKDGSVADDNAIPLSALTILEFSFPRKDSAVQLLVCLRLPVLRALTLGQAMYSDMERLSAGALARLPLLTHLCITCHALGRVDFGFMRALPTLMSVLLVGYPRALLDVLADVRCGPEAHGPGPRCVCPRLRTLALSSAEPATLEAMLIARAAAGHPIGDVKLFGGWDGAGETIKAWALDAKAELAADTSQALGHTHPRTGTQH